MTNTTKQKWEKMMIDVEEVKTTLDFSEMTDEQLMQEFGYWKRIAEYRMTVFRDYHGTELEDRTYEDYQKADYNAQAVYLEMNEKELSYSKDNS